MIEQKQYLNARCFFFEGFKRGREQYCLLWIEEKNLFVPGWEKIFFYIIPISPLMKIYLGEGVGSKKKSLG